MKRNQFHIPVVILCWLLAGFCSGCTAGKAGKGRFQNDSLHLTIVAFGNSVTATRKTVKQVFAQRLPASLSKEAISAKIINSGVPGSHSGRLADNDVIKVKHALERLKTDVLDHHPDLVLVDFGINDAAIDVRKGEARIPLPDFKRNMEYMVKEMQQNGIKVVLMTPNARGGNRKISLNKDLANYADVILALSKKYKTGFVDNFKMFMEFPAKSGESLDSLLLDGIHPNDRGHEMMAELITQEIVRLYKKELSK